MLGEVQLPLAHGLRVLTVLPNSAVASTGGGDGIVFMVFGVPLVIFARQFTRFNLRQTWSKDVFSNLGDPANRKARVFFRVGCGLCVCVGLFGIYEGLSELL